MDLAGRLGSVVRSGVADQMPVSRWFPGVLCRLRAKGIIRLTGVVAVWTTSACRISSDSTKHVFWVNSAKVYEIGRLNILAIAASSSDYLSATYGSVRRLRWWDQRPSWRAEDIGVRLPQMCVVETRQIFLRMPLRTW